MSMLTPLKAGLVALVLSATALAAVPAQAAPPNFSFSLNLGGPGFGLYPVQPGIVLHFGDPNYYNYCLNDKQVRKLINNGDFSHAKIAKYQNKYNKVWVIALSDDDDYWYQMRVDRCTGEVDHVQPIDYNPGNGNFSLSLGF
jgi:hypothetical protein